jgi:WD40 repeat protein
LREELRNSLLYQARALRQSGRAGQRFQSLSLLAQAAAIRPGPDLRSEAVACMQLMDVRESAWKDSPEGTYGWTFDLAHELYAWSDQQGNFHIRRMSDDFEMAFLPGFGRRAWIAQFSPGSQFFAAKYHPPGRSHPNQFYIWDIERQAKTLELPGGIYHEAFAFSADGVLAAAGLTEGVIVLVDLVEHREISRFPVEFEPNSLSFSPDGKWLAASSRSGEVYLFDPVSAEVVQKFAHPQRTRGIAWRPDGKLLAAPSDDGFIYLWNTETGRRSSVLAGHDAQVVAACFSQNGLWLASRGWDQAVRIWDVARSKPLLVLSQREFIRNYFSLNDTRFGPFRDGSRLGLWELAGPSDPYRSTGIVVREVTSAALSSDGKRLACSTPSGVSVWDLASAGAIMHWPLKNARAVAFSPEGHLLTAEKGLFLRAGRFQAEAELAGQFDQSICLWSSPSAICDDVALSQCGRKIAVSNGRNEAVVIHREPGGEPLFLSGHADVRFVAISPGGEWAATGTEHGKDVGIWETKSGRLLKLLPVMGGARVAFSPDGGWLVINTREGCSFVEPGSWKVRHQLRMDAPAEEGWLGRIVFSPDGLLLAVSRSRKIIQLFEGRSGEFLMNLETLVHAPVGFTEGGESLLVYGQHGEFFFWDMLLIRRQLAEIGLDWEARADRAVEFAINER